MQPKFAFNGLRLAKNVVLDLTLGEFSAGNDEFSSPFFLKSRYTGGFWQNDRFQGFKMCPNSTYRRADPVADDRESLEA